MGHASCPLEKGENWRNIELIAFLFMIDKVVYIVGSRGASQLGGIF